MLPGEASDPGGSAGPDRNERPPERVADERCSKDRIAKKTMVGKVKAAVIDASRKATAVVGKVAKSPVARAAAASVLATAAQAIARKPPRRAGIAPRR